MLSILNYRCCYIHFPGITFVSLFIKEVLVCEIGKIRNMGSGLPFYAFLTMLDCGRLQITCLYECPLHIVKMFCRLASQAGSEGNMILFAMMY